MLGSIHGRSGNSDIVNPLAQSLFTDATSHAAGSAPTQQSSPVGRSFRSHLLPKGSNIDTAQTASKLTAKTIAAAKKEIESLTHQIRSIREDFNQVLQEFSKSDEASATKIKQQQAKIEELEKQATQFKESPPDRKADSPGKKKTMAEEIENIFCGSGSGAASTRMAVGCLALIGLLVFSGPTGSMLAAGGLVAGIGYLAVQYFIAQAKKENEGVFGPPDRNKPAEPVNTSERMSAANSSWFGTVEEHDEEEDENEVEHHHDQAAVPLPNLNTARVKKAVQYGAVEPQSSQFSTHQVADTPTDTTTRSESQPSQPERQSAPNHM